MPNYRAQYFLSVVVTVIAAMLGAFQLLGPVAFGLPPQASAWAGLLAAGLGVLAGFLPRVTSTPGSPPSPH